MTQSPAIRRLAEHEWRTLREVRLRALADAPDAFGSLLAWEAERADEEWSERLAAGAHSPLDIPLIADRNGEAVGLAWGRIEPSALAEANLYQMWVAPDCRGLGVGRQLLDEVVAWAMGTPAQHLALAVTSGDSPARRLYERAGFVPEGEPEALREGSKLLGQRMVLRLESRRGRSV